MDLIAFWCLLGLPSAVVARHKGRSTGGWLVLGAAFGIFAFIAVVFLPSRRAKCPHCAEAVNDDARVCKHCGRDIAANLGAARVSPA